MTLAAGRGARRDRGAPAKFGAWLVHTDTRAGVVLAAGVVALYGWTVWTGFANDDFEWVQGARVLPGSRWWHAAFVSTAAPLFFRPVVQLSFFGNYLVFGSGPWGYHLTNVFLEGVNALLVRRLARTLGLDPLSSVLVAALFLAHASLAVAVTWVCARSDLLCATFFVSAVLAHHGRRTGIAAASFALALLSKETAALFPVVVVALDWVHPRACGPPDPSADTPAGGLRSAGGSGSQAEASTLRRAPEDGSGVRAAGPGGDRWWSAPCVYVAVLVAYLAVRAVATTAVAPPLAVLAFVSRGELGTAAQLVGSTLAQAARALLVPVPLGNQTALVGLCAVVAGCLWITRRAEARWVVWFGIAWMVLGIAPFLGHFTFSGYYVYLASIGFALMVVSAGRAALAGAGRWRLRLAAACVAAWIIASVVVLEQRNEQHRRNALMSARIIDAVVQAVPHPPSGALFHVAGIGLLRVGRDPWARSQVLLFGLPEALRLRFDDPTIEVAFDAQAPLSSGRPLISLRWDPQAGRMIR